MCWVVEPVRFEPATRWRCPPQTPLFYAVSGGAEDKIMEEAYVNGIIILEYIPRVTEKGLRHFDVSHT